MQENGNGHTVFGTRLWEKIDTVGDGYSPRTGHTAVSYGSSLYVFGGTDRRRRQQDLFQYNLETRSWTRVDAKGPLPPRRSGAHGIVHESNMYIFGGYDGRDGNYFNDLFYFNFETRCWNEMPSCPQNRPQARTDHIMVLYNDSIYIFGGYDGHCKYNSMYRYHIKDNINYLKSNIKTTIHNYNSTNSNDLPKWDKVISFGNTIPSKRFGHAGAVHENTKCLYIFGGWDGKDTLNDLYGYSFVNNRWYLINTKGKKPPHRYRHTCVIYGDNLFIFGGVNKAHSRFNDLQRLDLNTYTWTEVGTTGYIPSSRTFHRAVIGKDKMYLLGGYDGTDRLHDLYSIQIGPLVPESLLNICAKYARENLYEILKYSSFNGVPNDILENVLWGRDAGNQLRGKCKQCQSNQCSFYEFSRLKFTESNFLVTSSNRSGLYIEYTSVPCICGHTNSDHELIQEQNLCRTKRRMISRNLR